MRLFFGLALLLFAANYGLAAHPKTVQLHELSEEQMERFLIYAQSNEPHVWQEIVDEEGRVVSGIEWPRQEVVVGLSSKPSPLESWKVPTKWSPFFMSPRMEQLLEGILAKAKESSISEARLKRVLNERLGHKSRNKHLNIKLVLRNIVRTVFEYRVSEDPAVRALEMVNNFYKGRSPWTTRLRNSFHL